MVESVGDTIELLNHNTVATNKLLEILEICQNAFTSSKLN